MSPSSNSIPSQAASSTRSDFSGLWIPLVTPFKAGAVDHSALSHLVKKLCAEGATGFIPCGSTGEAASLDEEEQLAVLSTVQHASAKRPVVMGVSGYHLPKLLNWIQKLAKQTPLAGLLVPAPLYIRPSQTGLLHWFESIADASPLPIIVYDIPYRTGVRLEYETLRQLARHPNIMAMKDCGGDALKTQKLIGDGQLQVLAGEDAQIFSTLALGGVGAISASAHINTADFVRMMTLLKTGQLQEAQALWLRLLPLIEGLFAEPNPALIKALLAQQGLMTDETRAPMMPATPNGCDSIMALFNASQNQPPVTGGKKATSAPS